MEIEPHGSRSSSSDNAITPGRTPAGAVGARPLEAVEKPLLGGRFQVVRELGVGGMGAVYEVMHQHTHHRRALKMLKRREKDAESVARLLREASAAGRIGNRHIVETYDAGVLESGEAYVLMELLEGCTLFQYIRPRPELSLLDLATLVAQACEGLQAAHDAGIIHRDIKPSNLFVTMVDGLPFVKVIDFGISKLDVRTTEATQITQEGVVLGTPSYMAPEQLTGDVDIDGRADVYALGILLYAAVAGRRPFRGTSLGEIAVLVDRRDYEPLATAAPSIPAEFAAVIERAMHRDRDERYPNPTELADALCAAARGVRLSHTVRLRPPTSEPAPPASDSWRMVHTADLSAAPRPPRVRTRVMSALSSLVAIGVFVWATHGALVTPPRVMPLAELPLAAAAVPPPALATALAAPTPSASATPVAPKRPKDPPRHGELLRGNPYRAGGEVAH